MTTTNPNTTTTIVPVPAAGVAPLQNELFVNKGKLYRIIEAGPWIADVPIEGLKELEPGHHWTGGRITVAQQKELISFFEWAQEATKSEVIAHGFYNDALGQWKWVVFPQEGYNGMTVKLLPDHPDRIKVYHEHLGAGWEPMATAHTHCTSAAFQSGTDSADEKGKEGLHITIGHLGSGRYSLHARTSFRGVLFNDPPLSDWFEIDPAIAQALPPHLHNDVIKHAITTPIGTAHQLFPEWWKENVIKVVRAHSVYNGGGSTTPPSAGYHNPYNAAANSTPTRGALDAKWFRDDLAGIIKRHNWDLLELQTFVAYLTEPCNVGVIASMIRHDIYPSQAADIVDDLLDEQMEREMEQDHLGHAGGDGVATGTAKGPGNAIDPDLLDEEAWFRMCQQQAAEQRAEWGMD